MALKSLISQDEFDELDADVLRSEYKEAEIDGKKVFVLDVADPQALPQVKALKVALDREKNDRRTAATKLREAEAKISALPEGFDAEDYARMKMEDEERQKNPGAGQAELKQMFEQRLINVEKKRQEEVAARDLEIERLKTQAERREVKDKLATAVDSEGIAPHFREAVIAVLEPKVKTSRDDETGNVDVFFETDLGTAPVSEFVKNWAQSDAGKHFVVKPTGGGAQGGGKQRGDTEANPWKKDTWNLTQQGQIIRTEPDRARRLQRAAGLPVDVHAA